MPEASFCSPELLAFYGAQRALMRAKVELLRAQHPDDDVALPARERAAEFLRHAERLAWRARGPIVLVIGGPAVGGESTLAAELARRSGFEVLSARAPDEPRAYHELRERARDVVINGRSVIVNATFGDPLLHAEFVAGLRDSRALYALDTTFRSRPSPRLQRLGRRARHRDLTFRPSAGVEHVVDRIANWLDAREYVVCPPE